VCRPEDVRFKKYDMIAHTDGSAVGFGRNADMECRASAACILEMPMKVVRIGRYIDCATNNQAELCAFEIAINYALEVGVSNLLVVTDSRYCEGLLSLVQGEWEFTPHKNVDIVLRIRELISKLSKFTVVRVKGHRKGNVGNEQADKLAKECRESKRSHFSEGVGPL
jgi:ribonuclease HI